MTLNLKTRTVINSEPVLVSTVQLPAEALGGGYETMVFQLTPGGSPRWGAEIPRYFRRYDTEADARAGHEKISGAGNCPEMKGRKQDENR